MRIVGILGKSGAGKSTLAGLLAAELAGRGATVIVDSLARPIKEYLLEARGGVVPERDRAVMQHLGAFMRRWNPCFFIRELMVRNGVGEPDGEGGCKCEREADYLIVPDVRHRDEAMFCRDRGVVVLLRGSHKPLEGEEAAHISELYAETASPFDATFVVEPGRASLEDSVGTAKWLASRLMDDAETPAAEGLKHD